MLEWVQEEIKVIPHHTALDLARTTLRLRPQRHEGTKGTKTEGSKTAKTQSYFLKVLCVFSFFVS
jgi:hypothetical protein